MAVPGLEVRLVAKRLPHQACFASAMFCTMLCLTLCVAVTSGTQPRLRPPPMGYNPCMGTPSFGPHIGTCGGSHPPDEHLVLTIAAALEQTNLSRIGYNLIELDDGWPSGERNNKTGEIMADPKLFPNGMRNLSATLARMSPPIRLGLYTDRGTTTCGGKPGSAGHESKDVNTYARWGVSQIKSDSCSAPTEHHAAIDQYACTHSSFICFLATIHAHFHNIVHFCFSIFTLFAFAWCLVPKTFYVSV